MKPLSYHAGQRACQEEAGTLRVADKLADWVGPAVQFVRGADLFVLALPDGGGRLRFLVLSGPPPLVDVAEAPELVVRLPRALAPHLATPTACGGLAISLAEARRARVNGTLGLAGDTPELWASEAFTLCRKYFAPSVASGDALVVGPALRQPVPLEDPWLVSVLARAETSFLASVSPDGMPDVAHRGGRPGFLLFDPPRATLQWSEYVGDGIFKSAGNVRATGTAALLVPDMATGDGLVLYGRGRYETTAASGAPRENALVQSPVDYPQQGRMTCSVERAERVSSVLHPRRRIEKVQRITCRSSVEEQKPR
jgi:hypothetical protein